MSTLVYDPYALEEPAFFGTSRERLQELKDPSAWIDFELGRIDEAEFFQSFFLDRRAFDYGGLRQCFIEGYRWLEGMRELLADLRGASVEIHALSNYPPWYHLIEAKLKLSRYLKWSFVSCNTGMRKPQSEAYQAAARALQRPPQDCLFIDDRQSNCRAAEAVGMPALLFSDADSLRKRLESRDLL